MKNEVSKAHLNGLTKKQKLISYYYDRILFLKSERKTINRKLKMANEKFAELINSAADTDQLSLFENLDQFLLKIERGNKPELNE